ncbi:cell wall-binding repeat-containing protein [Herbiconiux sp. UC225_62]|uniref:cell wall-binding repeat-containing protein n=1 Tax=Herbiconiux sp. UC225_62 TaxID=3350168 RepID=UPI0036D2C8C7
MPVSSRAASRRRSARTTGVVALAAAILAALFAAGGLTAPPAHADGEAVLDPAVSRVFGSDRYDLASKIAQRTNPSGSGVVYVASGESFADALSAGPAAAVQGAALLLVPSDSLPSVVRTELAALNPHRVVVVGGALSVTEATVAQLRATVPHAAVERMSGADRYEVSRVVVADAFRLTPAVYLATGAGFADALTAGAVAANNGSPVVLIDGAGAVLDSGTRGLIASLASRDVVLAGGTGSISAGIEHSLPTGTTGRRVGGADRYEVSVNLNGLNTADFDTVYLATGSTFPDALAGGVLAGIGHHPLYVVPSDCVPRGALAQMTTHGTRNVVVLGGTASLGPRVEALTPCTW